MFCQPAHGCWSRDLALAWLLELQVQPNVCIDGHQKPRLGMAWDSPRREGFAPSNTMLLEVAMLMMEE